MRKIISSFITAALLLTILFSGYGISSASYELRFTTMPHSPHIWIDVMEEFSERVERFEQDGRIFATFADIPDWLLFLDSDGESFMLSAEKKSSSNR